MFTSPEKLGQYLLKRYLNLLKGEAFDWLSIFEERIIPRDKNTPKN